MTFHTGDFPRTLSEPDLRYVMERVTHFINSDAYALLMFNGTNLKRFPESLKCDTSGGPPESPENITLDDSDFVDLEDQEEALVSLPRKVFTGSIDDQRTWRFADDVVAERILYRIDPKKVADFLRTSGSDLRRRHYDSFICLHEFFRRTLDIYPRLDFATEVEDAPFLPHRFTTESLQTLQHSVVKFDEHKNIRASQEVVFYDVFEMAASFLLMRKAFSRWRRFRAQDAPSAAKKLKRASV